MAQAARKNKSRGRSARARGVHSWGMLLVGLISGLVLAALILGSQDNSGSGFGSGLKTLFKRISASVPDKAEVAPTAGREHPRPTLDFYTVLPKIERIIPDAPAPSSQQNKPQTTDNGDSWYVLQVASYQRFEDADRLKARLSLAGFEPVIQRVTVEDRKYFRVRLGPYDSQRKLKNVRLDLEEMGYSGISLKITEP
jgi:cell division protein FtsN